MNDKNPTPDESSTPDAPTVPVPPASELPTQPQTPIVEQQPADAAAPAAEQAPEPSSEPKRTGLSRGLLIGGGIAAAVILAGGGIAVGATIADDHDDDRAPFSDGPRDDDQDRGDDGQGQDDRPGDEGLPGDSTRDDDGPGADGPAAGGPGAGGPVTGIGSSSADDIVDVANAARGVADGEVTSIDAKRDGSWEVELTGSTGGETDVRVAVDGTATVVSSDDDDDTAPAHTLDEATIRALVAAALDEADGLITDLDADDDASSPYDVRVVTDDRRSIEIDFSADFAVVGTDTDD